MLSHLTSPDKRGRSSELGAGTEENFPDVGAGGLSSAKVQVAMDSVQRARRGLAVFFVVLIAVSLPFELDIARNGLDMGRFLPLVFVPAFASIVARLVMRE